MYGTVDVFLEHLIWQADISRSAPKHASREQPEWKFGVIWTSSRNPVSRSWELVKVCCLSRSTWNLVLLRCPQKLSVEGSYERRWDLMSTRSRFVSAHPVSRDSTSAAFQLDVSPRTVGLLQVPWRFQSQPVKARIGATKHNKNWRTLFTICETNHLKLPPVNSDSFHDKLFHTWWKLNEWRVFCG